MSSPRSDLLLCRVFCLTVAMTTLLAPLTVAMVISGETVRCSNEGENIFVPLVAADPCYRCFCRDGQVECETKKCPTLEGCHAILFSRPRQHCCDVCKGCTLGGIHLVSGEVRTNAQDKCIIIMCQAGVLTASREICAPPCESPVYVPGQCCPSCSGCSYDGRTHSDGDTFYLGHDSSVECTCQEGNVTCSKRACPVLNCPQDKIYIDHTERCPKCRGQRKVFDTRRSCFFSKRVFSDGDIHVLDNCTTCICAEGTMVCERQVCPEVTCPAGDHVTEVGVCCQTCRKWKSCEKEGVTWQHNETWLTNKCTSCTCNDGAIFCQLQKCSHSSGVCVQNPEAGLVQNNCCPVCSRHDGVCTVRGQNWSKIRTFDQLTYFLDGFCTHDLVRDCGQGHLNVKSKYVKSVDGRKHIDLIILQFGSTLVKLHSNLRIRVNRTNVYSSQFTSNDFSLRVRPSRFVVKAKLGFSINWNLKDHLIVKVSKSFFNSHRLCGVCGNFDGVKENDLVNRKGRHLEDFSLMARSWGRGRSCKKISQLISHNFTRFPGNLILDQEQFIYNVTSFPENAILDREQLIHNVTRFPETSIFDREKISRSVTRFPENSILDERQFENETKDFTMNENKTGSVDSAQAIVAERTADNDNEDDDSNTALDVKHEDPNNVEPDFKNDTYSRNQTSDVPEVDRNNS